MNEHDDDLASEVSDGDEVERDRFEAEDEDDISSAENPEEEEAGSAEDDSEI